MSDQQASQLNQSENSSKPSEANNLIKRTGIQLHNSLNIIGKKPTVGNNSIFIVPSTSGQQQQHQGMAESEPQSTANKLTLVPLTVNSVNTGQTTLTSLTNSKNFISPVTATTKKIIINTTSNSGNSSMNLITNMDKLNTYNKLVTLGNNANNKLAGSSSSSNSNAKIFTISTPHNNANSFLATGGTGLTSSNTSNKIQYVKIVNSTNIPPQIQMQAVPAAKPIKITTISANTNTNSITTTTTSTATQQVHIIFNVFQFYLWRLL